MFKIGDRVIINNTSNPCNCCTGKIGTIIDKHEFAPNVTSWKVAKDKGADKNPSFYTEELIRANSELVKEKLGI
jgi:uncharacterized protein YfcZ (UPF0381/DUF406 family)